MTMPRPFPSRSVVMTLKVLIIALAALLAYLVTHAEVQRLSRAIAMQQQQLQQQFQWQQTIATAKPFADDQGAQFTWQLGKWSEALNLALTLQPLNHDESILTAHVAGDQTSVTRLVKLSRDLSREGAWKSVWASQLISWKRLINGQARLHWQLTANLRNNLLKQRLTDPHVTASDCRKRPASTAVTHPPFADLELNAVVIRGKSAPVAYWRTASKQQIRTTIGDRFGESGDVLAAIFTDHIIVNEWQAVGDCWLLHARRIEL